VVVRTIDERREVVLIRTRNLKGREVWTLPKGTADEGEAPEATALREVREETGIEAEIIDRLDDITYWFVSGAEGVRYRKTVHFYLMRATGGDTGDHDDEVDEVRFVPVDEAPAMASYPTDRKVLQRIAELTRTW
jgi:ADP-ribose pyrophosphatase YjhB (NUDIX family)